MCIFRDLLSHFQMPWLTRTLLSTTSSQQEYCFRWHLRCPRRARHGPQGPAADTRLSGRSSFFGGQFPPAPCRFPLNFSAFKRYLFCFCLELIFTNCGKRSPYTSCSVTTQTSPSSRLFHKRQSSSARLCGSGTWCLTTACRRSGLPLTSCGSLWQRWVEVG